MPLDICSRRKKLTMFSRQKHVVGITVNAYLSVLVSLKRMNLTFDYGQVQYLNIGVRQNIERNKNRYENELLYQKPDLIEVMEIEINSTIYQQIFIKVLGNAWIVDEMT